MTRPNHAAILLSLLGSLLLAGCASPTPAVDLLARGDTLYRNDRFQEAAAAYGEVAERHPGDWHAQYGLGRSLLKLGEPGRAQVALEVAQVGRPDDSGVADALAESLFSQGKNAEGLRFLRERAERTRTPYDYLVLAAYYDALDDPDSAWAAIHQAIELDKGRTPDPYLAAADLSERLGDRREMIRRLRQAYGIAPSDPMVNNRLIANGEVPGPTLALPPGR